MAGRKIVIVTSAELLGAVYKNTTDLSFDGLVKIVHRGAANVSAQGFQTLWRTPQEGFQSLHPNPKDQVLVHTANALLHKQLLPGAPLEELTSRFLTLVEKSTRWDSFFPCSVLAIGPGDHERVVSLH